MPYIFHAYKRNTFRYNDGYRHLDDTTYIGVVKAVYGKSWYTSDDFDSSHNTSIEVKLPAAVISGETDPHVIKSRVFNILSEHFTLCCRCEHDCCGHYNGGPAWHTLKKLNRAGTKWHFLLVTSPNV